MDLIIDGYNLIGTEKGLRGTLEPKRNWLIQKLFRYQKRKGFNVTVVFDGWRSGSVNEAVERRDGVSVVYSRLGEKADAVIVRIARSKGGGCVVVSSDREIRSAVQRFGAVVLYAGEFSAVLRNVGAPESSIVPEEPLPKLAKKGNPHRLSKNERNRREKLKKLKP